MELDSLNKQKMASDHYLEWKNSQKNRYVSRLRSTTNLSRIAVLSGLVSISLTLTPHPVRADQVYWDGNDTPDNTTVGGGTGVWDGFDNNWTTQDGLTNTDWDNGDIGVFSGAAGGDVFVSGQQGIGGLTFQTNNYVLKPALLGGSLNLTSPETVITADPAITAEIGTVIRGGQNSELVKRGTGTVILSGNNTYQGGTSVEAGTLELSGGSGRLGSSSGSTSVSGGTLDLGNTTQRQKSIDVSGTGTLTNGRVNLNNAIIRGNGVVADVDIITDTATISDNATIDADSTIDANISITQTGGTMAATVTTPTYNMGGGTMSGSIEDADNVYHSGGTISGTVETGNYALYNTATLTGTVTADTFRMANNGTVTDAAALTADSVEQFGGVMDGKATTELYNLSGGTMSGDIIDAKNVNQSDGVLSGTVDTDDYDLSGGTLSGTGVVNTDTATISSDGNVATNGQINASGNISQTGGTMGGKATTDREYDLTNQGVVTGTGVVDAKTIKLRGAAGVDRNGQLIASDNIEQSGGTMDGKAKAPVYNMSSGVMSGEIIEANEVNQSGGLLSGTAKTGDYDFSRGALTGTVNSDTTTIRNDGIVGSQGNLNATISITQRSGTIMNGTASTPLYNMRGGKLYGKIINGVDVNQSGGLTAGTVDTENYDLFGNGLLTGVVTADTATLSQDGVVGSKGRVVATESIKQSGGTMGGTADTPLYEMSDGEMSGNIINGINVNQSGGVLSGKAKTDNYALSDDGVLTGFVDSKDAVLSSGGEVVSKGILLGRASITQTGGIMGGTAQTPLYNMSNGVMSGTIINGVNVNQSGGTLSGTANTDNYHLSGDGSLSGTGVVNADFATISEEGVVEQNGTLNVKKGVTQSGGTMAGNAKTELYSQSGGRMSGTVESNNYILSDGNASGTITAYRGFTLTNKGNFTGKVETNVFSQAGGTMQGTVKTNSYLLSGGTLINNNGRVTTKAFGHTGGEVRGDPVIADIRAIAMGGSITALSNSGIEISNTGQGIAISANVNSPIVKKTGTAILARETKGNINILTAGGVSGATGINAYATEGGNVNIVSNNVAQGTSGAAVSAGSTGGRVTISGSGAIAGGSHGVFVKSQNGDIDVKTGNTISGKTAIALETSGNGAINLDLGGLVTATDTGISLKGETTDSHATLDFDVRAGKTALRSENKGVTTFDNFATIRSTSTKAETLTLLDNVTGKATLNNHSGGMMQGVLSSGAGAETIVNNMAGGVWDTGNSAVFSLLGENDVIQNSGLVKVSGNTKFNGLETFENRAGGDLNLVNNKTTDRLAISGDYVGHAGSNISLDVDFDKGTSDIVTLGGVLVGKTNIKVNALSAGQDPSSFGKTILLVDVPDESGGGELTASGLPSGGVIEYNLIRENLSSGGSRYVVRSGIDGQAASSVVSGFIAAQNVIGSSFFKPSSGLVSAPVDPDKNQFGFAPWMRANGGLSEIDTKGTITQPDGSTVTAPAIIETSYYGYQFGLDGGIFNIQDTDANVNFGVTAGQITGKSDQKNYSNTTNFESVFYGAYAAYTKGPWFVDVQVRREMMDYTINVTDPLFKIAGAKVDGDRVSVSGSTSYTFKHKDWSFIPAAGFTYSNSSTDDLVIPATTALQKDARVRFDDVESMIAFGGITVSRNFFVKDETVRISPFVTLTGYHDFAGDIDAMLTVNPGSSQIAFPVKTERLKTYGEASLGVNVLALTGKINGIERLVIGSVRGDVQYGEDIFGGSMTAQFRMQF